MADKTKITKDWSNADQFLRERYEPTKKYVDNQINPEFVYDETAVSTKVVPQDVGDFAIVSTIYGGTIKSHNVLNPKQLTEATVNSIKFTPVYENGELKYIKAVGTASGGNADYNLTNGFDNQLASGSSYTVSGCPTGGGADKYRFLVQESSYAINATDYGNGAAFTANSNKFSASIRIMEGQTVNLTFYPMVRLTSSPSFYMPPSTLWNSPIESVVSYTTETVKLYYNKGYNSTTGAMVDNNVRSVSERYDVPFGGYVLKYQATSKSGKDIKVNVIGYDSANKEVSSTGWLGQTGTATLLSTWTKFAILIRNRDESTMVKEDASVKANINKTTISVPQSIKNLDGYGLGISDTVRNYVDFETGKYYRNVAEIDLGSLTWTADTYDRFYTSGIPAIKKPINNNTVANMICSKYASTYKNDSITLDKSISVETTAIVYIRDTSYSDAATFKNAMNGVKLIYELATPEVIDISDIIRPIKCETGGTITLKNEHNLDVANTIIYEREDS